MIESNYRMPQCLKYLYLMILVIIGTGACSASWSAGDGLLLGSFITAQGVDSAQTVEILNNPDYYERNPLIQNEAALIALKVASTATVVYLADKYPELRTPILIIGNVIMWAVAGYNHSIGVRP